MYLSIASELKRLSLKIAGYRGLIRNLEKFFEEENLPAKDWPPYVKKELLEGIPVQPRKNYITKEYAEQWRQFLRTREGLRKIKQFNLKFPASPVQLELKTDLSDFDEATRTALRQRISPDTEVRGVPHDVERQKTQEKILAEKGSFSEPIIVQKDEQGKLKLLEGWHRVIALIEDAARKRYPVVSLKAYVGEYAKPVEGILQKILKFFASSLSK